MKKQAYLLLAVALTAWVFSARADSFEDWVCYGPTGSPRPVTTPDIPSVFNCFLPENAGGYVAVWDQPANGTVLLERRSRDGAQLWNSSVNLAAEENTRIVLASASRILWCSAQRWIFLDREGGTNVATGEWDQPNLDANKVVIQNDILYIINGDGASSYDTNMNQLDSVSVAAPKGFWCAFGGAWLLDTSARTEYCIRIADIDTGSRTEIPLPATVPGGYVEHHVLSANRSSIFVISTISWPGSASHYFTVCTAAGCTFQNELDFNETITGTAPLDDGWLISTRSVGSTTPQHYLYKIDSAGNVQPHTQIDPALPQSYVALNTTPPTLLHVIDSSHLEVYDTTAAPWWNYMLNGTALLYPSVNLLHSLELSIPTGNTNYFWMSSINPNNK